MAATRRTQSQPQPSQQRPAPRPAALAAPVLSSPRSAVESLLAEDDVSIVKTDADALASITKSEVGMQLDAAHRWPRSIARFMEDAVALATMTKETAQSCMYTLPVRKGGDKPITGPSVRLAEMCATSWGNLHTGARIIELGARDVTAQALAWDLEKNLRLSIEVKRGIVTSSGARYGDDMIRVTSMAAISVALRNAIFRIIPRALVDHVYEQSKLFATGVSTNTFAKERDAVIGWFKHKQGVEPAVLFARPGVGSEHEMTPDHLATLIGWGSAIKSGDGSAAEIFAAPAASNGGEPRQARSKGAALDAMAAAHQATKSEPANDAPGDAPDVIYRELTAADEAWSALDEKAATTLVASWSPADRRAVLAWARANNDPDVDDGDIPARPACSVLGRQPGED